MTAENTLEIVDHYGLPILLLIGLWRLLSPLARRITEKHVEAVDLLTKSNAAISVAVDRIAELLGRFDHGNTEAHAETHDKLAGIESRMARIDARVEAAKEIAVRAEQVAKAAHARQDAAGMPRKPTSNPGLAFVDAKDVP